MAKNLTLELILKAKDYASRVVKSTTQQTTTANQQITDSTKRSAAAQQQAVQQTSRTNEQAVRSGRIYAMQLARDRERLVGRSERDIQREIQRTIAQYDRLKRSGSLTSRELARASEQARNQIRALNAEMGRTPMGQRLGNIGRGVMSVGAGVVAGAMVMAEPVRKSMGYDRDLAMVANTAFSDRDAAGRIEGKKELHNAVKNAVAVGGGTKEDALSALDQLLASGAVSAETAINLLPTLQKGAVATGADTRDLASIAISAMQQFGIDESQIGKVLDMAVAAGQAGNFELKDMARWLPQQMAAAKQMGLDGIDGLKTLLVANQQARVTAGTSDEAGNNLVNLLAKITSKETNERFEKLDYVDAKGKKRQINYLKSMETYKSQGKDSLQAFMAIMDDVVGSNKDYKALQEKLKTAKGEEQKKLLDQMTNLVQGTAIGQIISDRQALMALLGIRNNVQLGKEVETQVQKSEGAVETSHQVVRSTNDYKTEDLKATAEFAQMEGLKGFNDLLGQTSETLANYMKQYPELSSTLAGMGTGVKALGVAAIAAASSLALLGGKNGGLIPDFLRRKGGNGLGTSTASAGRQALQSGASKWGFLAKTGLVADLLFHSTELNKGETEFIYGIREKQENERRAKMTPEQLAEDDQRKAKQQQAVEDYRRYEAANKTLNDKWHFNYWWASDEEKEQAKRVVAEYQAKQKQQSGTLPSLPLQGEISLESSAKPQVGQFSQLFEQVQARQFGVEDQVQAVNGVLAQYQGDFAAFGQTISDGLQAGLKAQSHTIDNRITVELDGRVIAEQTSLHFFNFANRGQA